MSPNTEPKVCCVCNRPFQWRRKWAKCWNEVKYCSERCRRSRPAKPTESKLEKTEPR
ncbi:DUF2256 domain-containing protein [Rubripirellula tenax]|uniref:DUF2256 domain-containing protein n=1 Tax=Rubripirellula tenax TaxID=2528015 RepID=UPI0011B42BC5